MTSKLARNLEQTNLQSFKTQLNQMSARSFLPFERGLKSRIQGSILIDQENAKELQKIQKKTQQLKQKEKRQQDYLKRFKKVYVQQLKEFEQLDKVMKLALEQKSRQVEFLSMENNQLKEQQRQFETLKEQKQALSQRNQQILFENKKYFQQLESLQQSYTSLKRQVEQQSELITQGIQSNQIQTEPSAANYVPESLREVEQLNNALEEQKKKEIQEAVQKEKEQLNAQTSQIKSILETFLKHVQINEDKEEAKSQKFQEHPESIEKRLHSLTEELKAKSDQISRVIVNSHKLKKDLKQRESKIDELSNELRQQQQKYQFKDSQIENIKSELQICQDSERVRINTEFETKQKKALNFQTFQQTVQTLIEQKTLKQYLSVFEIYSNTSTEIFAIFRKNFYERNDSSDKFIQIVTKIIETNLNKLNDYFRERARREIQKIHKMTGFIQRADNVLQKHKQDEDIDQQEINILTASTPDRFSFKMGTEHRRQESESSTKSYKKSIVLLQDMDSAINYDEDLNSLKEEALQQQLSNLKNSQVILDSLKEDLSEGDESPNVKDATSESSFNKSKLSELSQVEQQRHYSDKRKTALLNAKLKKKKKH